MRKISEILRNVPLILCFSISVICAALVGAGKTASAEENYTPTIRSYDGVDYAGYLLDSGNVNDFSAKLNVSKGDLEKPIFQFVITPSVRGSGSSYSPDFESLTFTLADSKGKTMTITFAPRKADSPKWYYINGMAMGENQTMLGEHQGNFRYAADPEDGTYLTDTYAAISPYTFDGYGADSSWFPFYDKYGNTFTSGCNGVISIYYSVEENALYADTGYQWVDDDTNKEWTLTDKYTLSKGGERRYRIRDFDKRDYIKGNVNNVVSAIWTGFEDPSDITFTVSFSKVITEDPSILLVSLGGKSIVDSYFIQNHTKAVKGVAFPVPKPLYFSEGNSYDFASIGGKVSIEGPDGATVLSKRSFTDGMTFVPQTEGNYSVSYSVTDPFYSEVRTYKYSFETLESGGTELIPNGYDRNYVVSENIDAGCIVYNIVQDYLPPVNLKIIKDGSEIYSVDDLGDLSYRFESAGEYTFIYGSTDLLGRETVVQKNYSVSEYCLKIKQGLTESVVERDYSKVTKPSSADYYIVNVVTGNKITPTGVSIRISKNGGEFETYKASLMNGEGTYVVKYVYTYAGGSSEAQRRFMIYEELPTITVNNVPANTILADGSTAKDDIINLIALKGSVVSIPKDFFVCEFPFIVSVYEEGGSFIDRTDAYNAGNLTLTLNETKGYYVSAEVPASDGFKVYKNLFICVKDGFIAITPVQNFTENVGREITLVVPEAKDFYGNPVTGGSFSVTFNGEGVEVKNGKFKPKDTGVYKVRYSVSLSGYTEVCDYEYTIADNESPVIVFGNVTKKSPVGKFVKLEGYSVSDNSGRSLEVKVGVTFDGEPVAVYNGGFDAEKEGEYIVRITATDIFGNSTVKEYKVEASGRGGCSSVVRMSIVPIFICSLLAVAAVIFFAEKHKRIKK